MRLHIYQPNPHRQILLYDLATSSSVSTFLRMNDIEPIIKNFSNAEFMSENGRLPVVVDEDEDRPHCGFPEVYWFVCRRMSYEPNLLEVAHMDWVESRFLEMEMYLCWCHEPIVENYTKERYTNNLPWPVSIILFRRKRADMAKRLSGKFLDYEDFLSKFNQFLSQLEERILHRYYLGEAVPSCVDALVAGHIRAIQITDLDRRVLDSIRVHTKILNLTELIHKHYPS